MSTSSPPHRLLAGGRHPNVAAEEEEEPLEQALHDLLRIMTKVAQGDFSEKPEINEGTDAMSRFVVAFRFLIDDLERAHLQRQSEIDRLRELDQMKTRFINLAAHELNTPLTPISIHLHLLKRRDKDRLTPAQNAAIDALDRNFARMSRSVGDLLDVARLQNQGLQIHPTVSDLSHLVQTATEDFRTTTEQKGIQLVVDGDGRVQTSVDQDRITQVLYNLLSNAYKFTPEKGRIHVAVKDGEDHVAVSVTDSGIGLSREQMDRLFKPFSQVHRDGEALAGGTGLGLFISKGIVEAHGGRLWVDSTGKGQGARFTFVLPKTPPAE